MAKRSATGTSKASRSAKKSGPTARKKTATAKKPTSRTTTARTATKPARTAATKRASTKKRSGTTRATTKRATTKRTVPKSKTTSKKAAPAKKAAGPKRATRRATTSGAKSRKTTTAAKPVVRRREPPATIPSPPSSLNMNRRGSAARTGREEMAEARADHATMTPSITGGDVDADVEDAYFTGDEAPGGDNPTPDQDIVDDIGRALGVEYQDDEGTARCRQARGARQAPLGARPGISRGLSGQGEIEIGNGEF
ncbi:MAG: DUF6335 family protein [Vicinamibacterales bacterium]